MCGRVGWCLRGIAPLLLGIAAAAAPYPTQAQGLRTTIQPRARVFASVGPGVTALKRDPSGFYYVLAKPATLISIYKPDGTPVGQIPNANSRGAVIRYAVDFDISPEGLILVADRGANAIQIFAPDGTPVSRLRVQAPTSVVALPGGEFAYTALTSERLVQVLSDRGDDIRSFGDPSELSTDSKKKAALDLGRITGDSSGRLYFAFATLTDPTLRVYDRYGYVSYEAVIAESAFTSGGPAPDDRVQFAFNVGHDALDDQTNAWLRVGTSGDVRVGGGLGTGLLNELSRGGGFRLASTQETFGQSAYGSAPGAFTGPVGGTFSAQVTSQGVTGFQLGMGSVTSGGGFRAGRGGGSGSASAGSQSVPQGISLSFLASNTPANATNANTDSSPVVNPQDLSDPNVQAQILTNNLLGPPDTSAYQYSSAAAPPPPTTGVPGAFLFGNTFGSAFSSFGSRPGGFGGGFPGGAFASSGAGTASAGEPARGPRAGSNAGAGINTGVGSHGPGEHFGYHGRFGEGYNTVSASVRVNLGDLGTGVLDKPVITAVAVDPVTQEVWAGIGDSLVHFTKSGDPLSIFFLTLNGGKRLKPVALLVESSRILVATDPWGIFEFARPEGPAISASAPMHVVASPASSPIATSGALPGAPSH